MGGWQEIKLINRLEIRIMTYEEKLEQITNEIRTAKFNSYLDANMEVIYQYWRLGNWLDGFEDGKECTPQVMKRILKDIKAVFPMMDSLNFNNLKLMQVFSKSVGDWVPEKGKLICYIPWSYNCFLVEQIKNSEERMWLMRETIKYGWSLKELGRHIKDNLHVNKKYKDTTGLRAELPPLNSDLAASITQEIKNSGFLS